jgi:hypothetical protein
MKFKINFVIVMGFSISEDGYYILRTFDDLCIYKSLTKKGKLHSISAIKIQKWWRRRKTKLDNIDKTVENDIILMIPLNMINNLIDFFRYIFGTI